MKKLIVLAIVALAWGVAGAGSNRHIGYLSNVYRSCVEQILGKYHCISICDKRDKYFNMFGSEFGVCVDTNLSGDTGDFWEEYQKCKEELNAKGVYDRYHYWEKEIRDEARKEARE